VFLNDGRLGERQRCNLEFVDVNLIVGTTNGDVNGASVR